VALAARTDELIFIGICAADFVITISTHLFADCCFTLMTGWSIKNLPANTTQGSTVMINLSMMTEWFATMINELFSAKPGSAQSEASLKTAKILDRRAG
jgi:hypothetical protein